MTTKTGYAEQRIPTETWRALLPHLTTLGHGPTVQRMWRALIEGRWDAYDRERTALGAALAAMDAVRAAEPVRAPDDLGWDAKSEAAR